MKKIFIFLIIIFPISRGICQINNLKLIDDARNKYFHCDSCGWVKQKNIFNKLSSLLNNKDTIYLSEAISYGHHSYNAHIYIGNGRAIYLSKSCTGYPEKCKRIKLKEFKTNKRYQSKDLEFPLCYFEWFKTFDTIYLSQMSKKFVTMDANFSYILIRIIKGEVNIVNTNLIWDQVYDRKTGFLKCLDLNYE